MLKINSNPLLRPTSKAVDLAKLAAPQTLRRKRAAAKRELRDARKIDTAVAAIAGFTPDVEIYGFTKGQFSLLNLLQAIFLHTGPAHLSLSTWTAASHEIESLAAMRARGDITGMRLLIDFSMARREPAMTAQMRDKLGRENIRVAQTHSKFAVFQNPRNEDFTLAHDPELAAFLNRILDEVWAKQRSDLLEARPGEILQHWQNDL